MHAWHSEPRAVFLSNWANQPVSALFRRGQGYAVLEVVAARDRDCDRKAIAESLSFIWMVRPCARTPFQS